MQALEATITIPIPDGQVLISEVRLRELERNEFKGVFWSMKDLEQRIGRKRDWIKENILYQPRYKKKLDVANGGFVFYPDRGQEWAFKASEMTDFLEKNFADIFKR